MKLTRTLILLPALFLSTSVALAETTQTTKTEGATSTTTTTTKTKSVEDGVVVNRTQTRITGTDDLAIGDPLGNRPMSPSADAGPRETRSYCTEGSTAPHCVRAAKRQSSPTTWQEDCARGTSTACGTK